ncbi:hypothetical protein [Burkholderia sp. BCC1644]|uniref:hypothetical protein n=1 Tax=Burkholderia sp. BCC1644 TaxID=2676293 RepID=UPI001592946E|nr:hypothetical protein [Burkholderia sp. BCC1644]
MATLAPEQLLAEIEDIIRTMPPRATIRHELPENFAWLGRASAAMRLWDPVRATRFDGFVETMHAHLAIDANRGIRGVQTMLHQAGHELRMQTLGPVTIAMGQGAVFDYFDEVRKVVEAAKNELLFVDPYLDAEFVSRYLPHVAPGVTVRLLGRERMTTLLPAVELLRQQNSVTIEVRSATGFHDRYVFVDRLSCYQSGSSFKDGAKKAPTTLTQIVDAFDAMQATYQELWDKATPRSQSIMCL